MEIVASKFLCSWQIESLLRIFESKFKVSVSHLL